jgi:hypothetical protein
LEFLPNDECRGRGRGDSITILDDNEHPVAMEEEIDGIYLRNARKSRLLCVIQQKKYRSYYNQLEDSQP